MTSERQCYAWIWLPGETDPVVAGVLAEQGNGQLSFTYGKSYLGRAAAVPIYKPDLPLDGDLHLPGPGHAAHGCIRDAGPDSWGQRVIMQRLGIDLNRDSGDVSLFDYLLESGSDRIGALDFQEASDVYLPRHNPADLATLLAAATALEMGESLPPELAIALQHGTAVGGARPKALLVDEGRHLIAKFSSSTDITPVVRYEALAMDLAQRVGLDVAPVELLSITGKDVLLVERFDRPGDGTRRMLVSALTMFGLDEMFGHYGTYWELADLIRKRFTSPDSTLRELFARITFNMLVSNTDDHARNHAAFWTGTELTLTPAYDVAPQNRAGNEQNQALAYGRPPTGGQIAGEKRCQVRLAVAHAETYGLSSDEASDIVNSQVTLIHEHWDDACTKANLTVDQRKAALHRQFLNPSTMQDWKTA